LLRVEEMCVFTRIEELCVVSEEAVGESKKEMVVERSRLFLCERKHMNPRRVIRAACE
jgi:hypothetical protein